MPALTPDAWAQIRYAYEHTDTPVEDICLAYGTTATTLRDRMRRWRWTRRRPPIPRDGPSAVPARGPRAADLEPTLPEAAAGSPTGTVAASRHDAADEAEPSPHRFGAGGLEPAPFARATAASAASPAPADGEPQEDPETIVPRLQNAAARVLPAIEATIARLAAGPGQPREMEQAGRALSSLTRTLRELNTLLAQQQARAADDADLTPKDIEDIRAELAERLHALIDAAERDKQEQAKHEETW